MHLFPVTFSLSVAKLTGFLSSGLVGAVIGRFGRRSGGTTSGRQNPSVREQSDEMRSRATDTVPMSPALLQRMRAGRLPLPPRVADLTPDDEPSLAEVNAFADHLAELPVSVWLDVGRTLVDDFSIYARRATPFAILEATIHDRGLAVAAWYVRDAIDTSAHYAASTMPRWTRRERRDFAAAHAVAEEAALALLARSHLSDEDYSTLFAPFEPLAG